MMPVSYTHLGEVTVDPLRKITGPKHKKPLPVFLKESEMDKLLDDTDRCV